MPRKYTHWAHQKRQMSLQLLKAANTWPVISLVTRQSVRCFTGHDATAALRDASECLRLLSTPVSMQDRETLESQFIQVLVESCVAWPPMLPKT